MVSLNFTNPTSGLTVNYAAYNCRVVTNTAVECQPQRAWRRFYVDFGSDKRPSASRSNANQSLVFRYSRFAYDAPVVKSIFVPNAYKLSTKGGTRITITGENFGPIGLASSAIGVKYARGLSQVDLRTSPPGIEALLCNVSKAHSEISCFGAPGIGIFLDFGSTTSLIVPNALGGNQSLGTIISYELQLSSVDISNANSGLTVSGLLPGGYTGEDHWKSLWTVMYRSCL